MIGQCEFTHRGQRHVGLIFEILGKSLYSFLKRNEYRPYTPYHVKRFAYQLLKAVAFCHHIKLIHTDLKMENVLLVKSDYTTTTDDSVPTGSSGTYSHHNSTDHDANKIPYRIPVTSEIRLIDFGGAIWEHEHHSSMVQTRQYRAPEVVLGIGWSYAADLFSVGAIFSEMATGNLLFATHNDAEHLQLMQRILGTPFPPDMVAKSLAKHSYRSNNEDANGTTHSHHPRADSNTIAGDAISTHANSLLNQWSKYAIQQEELRKNEDGALRSDDIDSRLTARHGSLSSRYSNGSSPAYTSASDDVSRSDSQSSYTGTQSRPSRSPSTAEVTTIFDIETGLQRWPLTAPDRHSIKHVSKQATLSQLHGHDPKFLDLLRQLLRIDPTQRTTAADALKHPYFDDIRDEMKELDERLRQESIAADEARRDARRQQEPEKLRERKRVRERERSHEYNGQCDVRDGSSESTRNRKRSKSKYAENDIRNYIDYRIQRRRYRSLHDSRSRGRGYGRHAHKHRRRHTHRGQREDAQGNANQAGHTQRKRYFRRRERSKSPGKRYDVRDVRYSGTANANIKDNVSRQQR